MNSKLSAYIEIILQQVITDDRKEVLQPLINYIQQKAKGMQPIYLNFICTHNSRRSHLAQVWSQVASHYYGISDTQCYSGGTETTAMFPKIAETFSEAGFEVWKLSEAENSIYAIKYDENALPIIGFSKKYDDTFNPVNHFAAIMTCSQADGGCPFIPGAEKRIPITFEDPKISDNTAEQTKVYNERRLQVASEMFYVFSQINT